MKTKEAPKKLYVALNELTEDGRTFVLDHHVDYPTCTEYTRTDAFVKKACEWLECNLSDRTKEEIEFWIDDFRKYMEG